MIATYCQNGKFNRIDLALDVKNGKISSKDLVQIFTEIDQGVRNATIVSPYIGTKALSNRKKSEWTERYLEYLLAEVSSSEVFNKASMRHLLEVATYVNSKGQRKLQKFIFILVGLLIIFLTGFILGTQKKNTKILDSSNQIINQWKQDYQNLENLYKRVDEENQQLKEENQELTEMLENVRSAVKLPSEAQSYPKDELTKIIERALKGENVREEFQKTEYTTEQVQERALEMKLTRKDAEKLVKNLVNKDKFDLNKFPEE